MLHSSDHPLFIKLDQYKTILDDVHSLRKKTQEAERLLMELERLQESQAKLLSSWKEEISEVKRKLFVIDDETGEETPRQNWRGVVDPGDTKKVDALLGAFSEEVKAAAGKNLGGWAKLEQNRTKTIEAVENV